MKAMKGKYLFLIMVLVIFALSATDGQAKPKGKILDSFFKFCCDQADGEIVEILDPDDGSVMVIYCCYFDSTLGYKVCANQDNFKINGNKLRPSKPAQQVLNNPHIKKNIKPKAPPTGQKQN